MNATLETVLARCGVPVYYIKEQKNSVVPRIVYAEVNEYQYGSMSGPSGLHRTRFSITCVEKDQDAASALSDMVEAQMAYNRIDFKVAIPVDNKSARYNNNFSLYYVTHDYFVWY